MGELVHGTSGARSRNVESLQRAWHAENAQLKAQLSATEERYKRLEEAALALRDSSAVTMRDLERTYVSFPNAAVDAFVAALVTTTQDSPPTS